MRPKPAAKWQLRRGKARFELGDAAVEKGRQIVIRRGVDTAGVVSIDEWQKSKAGDARNWKDVLLGEGRASIFQFQSAAPADRARLRCLIDPLSDRYRRRVRNAQIETAPAALAWLRNLSLGHGYFSALTFGEIQKGVEMTGIHDPRKANEIESWALQLELTSQVLPTGCSMLA
jgi:hypothetical protein